MVYEWERRLQSDLRMLVLALLPAALAALLFVATLNLQAGKRRR